MTGASHQVVCLRMRVEVGGGCVLVKHKVAGDTLPGGYVQPCCHSVHSRHTDELVVIRVILQFGKSINMWINFKTFLSSSILILEN